MLFKSHPNKKLLDHLLEVEKYSVTFLNNSQENIIKALRIICKCHDFGKYTTYFQKHLDKQYNGDLSHHGFISAMFGAFVGLKTFGEDNYLPLVLYSVILHHHGNLEDVNENLPRKLRFNLESLRAELKFKIDTVDKQIKDMKNNYEIIYNDSEVLGLQSYFKEFIDKKPYEDILRSLLRIRKLIERNKMKKDKIYTIHQLLYSCLIDADKLSASNTPLSNIKVVPYSFLHKRYLDLYGSKTGGLNDLRKEIFNTIQNNLIKGYKESKYFSITAPTGSGKTLAGFFAAKKLVELLGDNRRIIYVLPYTSIIDQNYSVILDLHKNIKGFEKSISQYILKHHHLSDIEYKSEEESYEIDSSQLLVEGWQSSIIVTTFVQFFETIIGYRNRMLKKFHNIKGSIIILDELQTIDIKYWKLIDYMLKKICNELDCRVITMTATRPIILRDAYELLDNYEKYFHILNRVTLVYDRKELTIEEFCENFTNNIEDKSYLIICNTIGQSLQIYNILKKLDRKVLYLSTNIVPKERRERIKKIKDMMNIKPIVISTQVVEAGVDLDFDIVYRDLAPLDSIIQAAGRCNRNGDRKGELRVAKLVKDDRFYGSYIYGKTLLLLTDQILQKGYFKESEFINLIQSYFNLAVEKVNSVDDSDKLIQFVDNMQFTRLRDFSIIRNRPDYIDVYFEINEEAKELFNKYKEEVLEENDFKKKYNRLLKLKPKLREYIISLPIKFINEFIDEKSFFRMPLEAKGRIYNDDIGFNRNDLDKTIIL
ncbi:CRISPR-associated helicase Cas3' [Caloranaerobacter sp. DY30410]|uniref:CRISPR-associated helicase Cas3' n=1 Tax=Caloranaerobacter sp. DY30410 TaxID=3238305 RepID=UPI003CFE6C1C